MLSGVQTKFPVRQKYDHYILKHILLDQELPIENIDVGIVGIGITHIYRIFLKTQPMELISISCTLYYSLFLIHPKSLRKFAALENKFNSIKPCAM